MKRQQIRELIRHPDALECALVLGAAAVWLLLLTPSSGGFHDVRTAITAVALLPALLVVRPWRTVGTAILLLVGGAALGGLVVLLTTAPGWAQADSVAGQVLGLLALVVTAGFARTPVRRRAVALVLITAVVLQFVPAWKAWYGSGDPNHLLVGTFYWHNQLGIEMTALALLATAHALGGVGRSRGPAALAARFAVASVVLSTSRTCLALLAIGLLLLLPLVRSARAGAVWVGVPLGAGALLVVLTSSLFFATPWSGISAVETTANNPGALGNRGTSSLATNGGDRARWTEAALTTWTQHPVLGDGFGSFRYTVGPQVPEGASVSAFVHDGYAEALTSGGLVFGLPLLAVWALVGLSAVRRYLTTLRRGAHERSTYLGASLATGVLLVHSAVDFDWHYASLVVLLGVTGGLLQSDRSGGGSRARVAAFSAVLAGAVGIAALASLAEHHGRAVEARAGSLTPAQLLDARWWGIDDLRLDTAALEACVAPDGSLAVPKEQAVRAVAATARGARLDPDLRSLRAQVSALSR